MRKKKKQWSLQVWVSLKNQSSLRMCCTIQFPCLMSSHHHHHRHLSSRWPWSGFSFLPSISRIFLCLEKTPCSPLISVQLPRSAVLLTEHQIKKVSQFFGLRGNFPQRQKALKSIFPVSYNPLHRRTSLCSSTNEHSSLKKQSSLQWFAPSVICICSIHPPYFATPTHFYCIRS